MIIGPKRRLRTMGRNLSKRFKGLSIFAVIASLLLVVSGCAQEIKRCALPEDNSPHHYLSGMELLDRLKLPEASAKFERALFCDEKFSSAHSGLAMVSALKATETKGEGYRKVDSDAATKHLKEAKGLSNTPEDEFANAVAEMRVSIALKPGKWLEKVEDAYEDALKQKVDERRLLFYDGREAADYFMGVAYLDAREFQKARDSFGRVISAKKEGKWLPRADAMWKRTDKIVRALAGITVGDVGKEVALKPSVTRGDMAAMIIDELKIDKLFAGRIPVRAMEGQSPDFIPADMLTHQFKEEVATLMKWNIRGLEPVYDQTTKAFLFKPEATVSRKEFALMLEDVLIKITGDDSLATAYLGHERSPFPDITPSAAWYNAAMNMTTRGIMEPELSGEFRPNDSIDGAEAVLAIRVLRQRLNIL
jgi:tetratricopeptide (TPR) repeat protein